MSTIRQLDGPGSRGRRTTSLTCIKSSALTTLYGLGSATGHELMLVGGLRVTAASDYDNLVHSFSMNPSPPGTHSAQTVLEYQRHVIVSYHADLSLHGVVLTKSSLLYVQVLYSEDKRFAA